MQRARGETCCCCCCRAHGCSATFHKSNTVSADRCGKMESKVLEKVYCIWLPTSTTCVFKRLAGGGIRLIDCSLVVVFHSCGTVIVSFFIYLLIVVYKWHLPLSD